MQSFLKVLALVLCLMPMSNSLAQDENGPKPFDLMKGRPVALAAWAITLYAASLVTGKAVMNKFEKVVEKTIKAPQDKEAKAAYRAGWFNFLYLPTAFVGAILVKRYAHKIFGDRVGVFGLFTAEQYTNNFVKK